jgi:predicted nuclease with TOPRIM domain
MMKKIKYIIEAIKNYESLQEELVNRFAELQRKNELIKDLRDEVADLKEKAKDPIAVVNALTDGQFEWYDYEELTETDQIKYYTQAQEILKKEVFQNELAALSKEFISWAAQESRDFDGVLAMRHQISGANMFKERLEGIMNPQDREKEVKEPYATL